MSEEIEVKYLDVDPKEIEERLIKLGAKKEFDRNYRVTIFDYPDLRLNEEASWVRLRDEGDKVTFSFKKRLGVKGKDKNDDSMLEHEVIVNDYDVMSKIMLAAGFIVKFLEEKHRIRYLFEGIEFDIDEMPGLEPFLEIEANSWEDIKKGTDLLGLKEEDIKICSAFQIYEMNGINMLDYSEFRFSGLVKRK